MPLAIIYHDSKVEFAVRITGLPSAERGNAVDTSVQTRAVGFN
jgi:hypothetical protein